jgi:NADPH:quinone reductase-like Zn-dependent oxidoreductase
MSNEREETAVTAQQRVIIQGEKKPYSLDVIEEPPPVPAAGEVRLRVEAAGVAFADVLARNGLYPGQPDNPFTPGYDAAGVVDAVGDGVTELQPGQRAAAIFPKFGAYAEYVCAPAELAVPVPDGVDPAAAVSVVLNYLTAHRILHVNARVQPGERILVHSAAGGVGTALLQLGRIAGLEMFGTASAAKHDLVTAAGATAIDYKNEDFAERVRALTQGEGVDVVCDSVGGDTMARSYKLLRRGGRLVNYGFLGVTERGMTAVIFHFIRLFSYKLIPDGKKATFYGNTPTHAAQDLAWYRDTLARLFAMLAAGEIDPVIGKVLPLTAAAEAQQLLETGAGRGKIVLTPPA